MTSEVDTTEDTKSNEVEVTIFTDGGRALRFKTNDLTLYSSKQSLGAVPNIREVTGITVNAGAVLLDTEDESAFVLT